MFFSFGRHAYGGLVKAIKNLTIRQVSPSPTLSEKRPVGGKSNGSNATGTYLKAGKLK